MTSDEYWTGHPLLVTAYYKAYKMRLEQENRYAWMQGAYMGAAFNSVISKSFGKKGSRGVDYPKQPFDLGLDLKSEVEKAIEAQREREKLIEQLNAWKRAFDRRFQKSGENT